MKGRARVSPSIQTSACTVFNGLCLAFVSLLRASATLTRLVALPRTMPSKHTKRHSRGLLLWSAHLSSCYYTEEDPGPRDRSARLVTSKSKVGYQKSTRHFEFGLRLWLAEEDVRKGALTAVVGE